MAQDIAKICFDKYSELPASGKPQIYAEKCEWTVLSGIVMIQSGANYNS